MADKREAAEAALFGRIERLRRDRGLTVEDLAARANVDRGLLESFANGIPDIDLSVFGRLATALGVDSGELFEGIEWVPDGHGGGDYRVADSSSADDA